MKISKLNNLNNKNVTFAGDDLATRYANAKKDFKTAIKEKAGKDIFERIFNEFSEIEKLAKGNIKEKNIPKIFTWALKLLGKVKVEKTGNKAVDSAAQLTKVVLWGNVGKELVGTALYTVQALTNQDLPEDKRKFVGMYDLAVGVVSTIFSFIFGVGLNNLVNKGYKNILKPLSESPNAVIKSRAGAVIVGLTAFSSFFLQTIIGKRIVAPAVATPVAGKLKKYLQEKEAANKNPKPSELSLMPPEALVLAKTEQKNVKL